MLLWHLDINTPVSQQLFASCLVCLTSLKFEEPTSVFAALYTGIISSFLKCFINITYYALFRPVFVYFLFLVCLFFGHDRTNPLIKVGNVHE